MCVCVCVFCSFFFFFSNFLALVSNHSSSRHQKNTKHQTCTGFLLEHIMSSSRLGAAGAKTHRMQRVEQLLKKQKKHPLTEQDKDSIIACFLELEGDLDLTKRRISQRSHVFNRTKEERTELLEQITDLQQDIYALREQVALRDAAMKRAKQTEKDLKAQITVAQEETLMVRRDLGDVLAKQAPLATCDAVMLSHQLAAAHSSTHLSLPSPGTATHSAHDMGTRHPTHARSLQASMSESALDRFADSFHNSHYHDADADDDELGGSSSNGAAEGDAGSRATAAAEKHGKALTRVLGDVLASATRQICVMTQTFTSRPLADALAAASQRGVQVKVLVDASWIEATLRASGASRDSQCWQRVYKRFKSANVLWAAQHGRRQVARPSSTHVPFTHNAIIVDDSVLVTGPLRFADVQCGDAESSLVVVRATQAGCTPSITSMASLFHRLWASQVEVAVPNEITRVRLPKL